MDTQPIIELFSPRSNSKCECIHLVQYNPLYSEQFTPNKSRSVNGSLPSRLIDTCVNINLYALFMSEQFISVTFTLGKNGIFLWENSLARTNVRTHIELNSHHAVLLWDFCTDTVYCLVALWWFEVHSHLTSAFALFFYLYRLQTKFREGNVFAWVCLLMGIVPCPPSRTYPPPVTRPPSLRKEHENRQVVTSYLPELQKWAVHILLECFLVLKMQTLSENTITSCCRTHS